MALHLVDEQSRLQMARSLITRYGQEHLLDHFNTLSEHEQVDLIKQILSVDFPLMRQLYRELVINRTLETGESQILPMQATSWPTMAHDQQVKLQELGWQQLKAGKVAALMLAGGQGSRLGHSGPKGTFSIGLPSAKSLFQLHAERLLALSRLVGRSIPWYIMTSPENHDETIAFFSSHQCFGYPQEEVHFFTQGELPALDEQGKVLLTSPGQISTAPDGNGGCFLALEQSGGMEKLRRRGVEWIYVYYVDNILAKVADPSFVGFAEHSQLPIACKVVPKVNASEKVGVLCYRDGRPDIVEYSDISTELSEARDQNGELLYNWANTGMYLFRRSFLEQCVSIELPYHVAHKRVPSLNAKGHLTEPAEPNAYKFELFLFDIMRCAADVAALQVVREEEFAPVKNREGDDSPASAHRLIIDLHRKWLRDAGLPEECLAGQEIEISPLLSYAGEGLQGVIHEVQNRTAGSHHENNISSHPIVCSSSMAQLHFRRNG